MYTELVLQDKDLLFATLLIKAIIKCYCTAQRSPSILVTRFAKFSSKGMQFTICILYQCKCHSAPVQTATGLICTVAW